MERMLPMHVRYQKRKKKKRLETNCLCVLETKVLPYKGPRLKTLRTLRDNSQILPAEE